MSPAKVMMFAIDESRVVRENMVVERRVVSTCAKLLGLTIHVIFGAS